MYLLYYSYTLTFIIIIFSMTLLFPPYVNTTIQSKQYNGYKVMRTYPKTNEQYEVLRKLYKEGDLDFWSEIRKVSGETIEIMIGPHQMKRFESIMKIHLIPFKPIILDVQKIITQQKLTSLKIQQNMIGKKNEMNWEDYQRLSTIYSWLYELEKNYPNLITIQEIGKSFEGRNIIIIKISSSSSSSSSSPHNNKNESSTVVSKPSVYIDGNIHGREWISISTMTYIINELVNNRNEHEDLLSIYDFYIVPTINPDGYEYSHTGTIIPRMWRKTMSGYNPSSGQEEKCFGVDGNRNWDYLWGQGGSNDKCHYQYKGPSPFSEPETLIIQKYILNTNSYINWKYFLTVHSFGQYILVPYGNGSRPSDFEELLTKANIFVNAVFNVNGTIYEAGNSKDILYETGGTSSDWAKGIANIKYSYTIELSDKGDYGFLLPSYMIKIVGNEFWIGVKAMLRS